jgi:hypothetical protein
MLLLVFYVLLLAFLNVSPCLDFLLFRLYCVLIVRTFAFVLFLFLVSTWTKKMYTYRLLSGRPGLDSR